MSEPDVPDLLSVAQAIEIIDAQKTVPRAIEVALSDALGFVLAEDLRADRDFPPFDKSLMDGFAVRSRDVARVPSSLKVIGTIAAGAEGRSSLGAGQAAAIMTGAPIPDGADAVVPVEETEPPNAHTVVVQQSASPGDRIAPRGTDRLAGDVVLPAGTRLGPVQLGVAAAVGTGRVRVYARPRVAVLSTGDEIVPVEQTPGPSQIRNSNGPMLLSLLKTLHCEPIDLGHVRDDPEAIRGMIQQGLAFDALVIVGGMSMGQFDYVPRLLRELDVDLKITKLRIKPGKPFVFGVAEKSETNASSAFVFGLPGNPVSALVCMLRLGSRLLARMGGQVYRERWIEADLASPLPANGPREFYLPARLENGRAEPLKWKGSADLFTVASADALLVRAGFAPALPQGAKVRLLEIPQ